jgi:hypothetical protein
MDNLGIDGQPLRKLAVDMGELTFAFEDASWTANYYLDTETGHVITIMDETHSQLEELYEEAYERNPDSPPELAALLEECDLHDWQKRALLEADQVEAGWGSRYIGVPTADSHQGYRDMERFIVTVENERLQDRLWRAIAGRGAFRYFKDVLTDYPAERERWFEFKERRLEQRVIDWLASEGIEPVRIEPPKEAFRDPGPPIRSRFLAEALLFARNASKLAGVTRIALIGSLTTGKPNPRDVDVLVTVTDEADLAPLATLGRKLSGHCQSMGNYGGDVFLADPQGHYLGRTCPWKRCGPGIRISCDAEHCGRRPYLHDDLRTIRLNRALIAAPPIELWPEIVARVPVPEDVEQELLRPLREGSAS